MRELWKVECFADAPMLPRAWFPNRADAEDYGRTRFGGDAYVTRATPDEALELARAVSDGERSPDLGWQMERLAEHNGRRKAVGQ